MEGVMPLFRQKNDPAEEEAARARQQAMQETARTSQQAMGEAARSMLEWAYCAPPGDLAAELMAAFGPAGPYPWHTAFEWLFRGYPCPSGIAGYRERKSYADMLERPILEAIQLLQHAELVVESASGEPRCWYATRLGLATLANGKAAVRQRIKDRTGL
jgi:hypothetical protein